MFNLIFRKPCDFVTPSIHSICDKVTHDQPTGAVHACEVTIVRQIWRAITLQEPQILKTGALFALDMLRMCMIIK
ncbi:hypothetical protein DFO67_12433 [Modicisalibacter xianhensis]|uniref:Uncharacterized protein n=1 Tax=Modicisalibacter xianhensis TaxID=442341 RepID=A0A4R8FD57_9GAMM|nr:hypothetical protein DFO67_12433 [Halomonas xianhensis]